ncbi:MAG TPA: hypothetical protein VHL53_14080, partial [Acidimicrobiia bacterium]|nr:hypothetical protein [Acidimicrobiia bacterium]
MTATTSAPRPLPRTRPHRRRLADLGLPVVAWCLAVAAAAVLPAGRTGLSRPALFIHLVSLAV